MAFASSFSGHAQLLVLCAFVVVPAIGHSSDACNIDASQRVSCGSGGIDRRQCEDQGCCWYPDEGGSRRRRHLTCYQQIPDHRRIICPFLSTLINEGSLPVKPSYTREELQEVTIQAGLSEEITIGHVEGNFMHNPAGVQDIFNMEGAANEHITSTGVHDCPTFYYDCKEDSSGVGTCTNTTLECKLPNKDRFESFFSAADANSDLHLTREELTTFAQGYPDIVDGNPLRVGGSIEGSHQAILEIFGEPRGERISKESLRRIFIDRRFPGGYTFPSPAAP